MNRAVAHKQENRPPVFLPWVVIAALFLLNCGDFKSKNNEEWLIRVKDYSVTAVDFNNALEFAKTAYPHNTMQASTVSKSIRLRLFNQLIEELILLQKAKDLGISVSDAEIDAAIAEIKSDYPEDVFEQTFLENAISYDIWKERMIKRLIIEKVIASELKDKIVITQEDIAEYYVENYMKDKKDPESIEDPKQVNHLIVKSIRRKKAEEEYRPWISRIKNEYTIDINKELWEKLATP